MVTNKKIKIINTPENMNVINFLSDPLGDEYVDIVYTRKGKFVKSILGNKVKRYNIPKGYRVILIENHKPTIKSIKITLKKK